MQFLSARSVFRLLATAIPIFIVLAKTTENNSSSENNRKINERNKHFKWNCW